MKSIIGRREWFSIPEFGVDWVRGKIDTGARRSVLHAREIRPFQKAGERWVKFKTIDDLACEAAVVFVDHSVERHVIEITVVTLDGNQQDLLVALSCRASKKCPLVLGRGALTGVLVDSSQSQLLGKL